MGLGQKISVVACGAALVAGVGMTSAAGAGQPSGGAVKVFVTPGPNGTGSIVVTGAIGDYGKILDIYKDGKPDPDFYTLGLVPKDEGYVLVTLQKGTFEIDAQKFDTAEAIGLSGDKVNPMTCWQEGTSTAPVTTFAGTGLYKGISGTTTLTLTIALVYPTVASGKDKGKCDVGASPVGTYESIVGQGSVSFG